MKRYLLLRDNQESGPFTLEELKTQKLKPLDLLWIENESTSWKYPIEISELKPHVHKEVRKPVPIRLSQTTKPDQKINVFVALPKENPQKENLPQAKPSVATSDKENVELETHFSQPLDEIKEMYVNNLQQQKFSFQKNFQNSISKPNPLWAVGLFVALVFGALTVKSIVESNGEKSKESKEITATATALHVLSEDEVPKKPVDDTYQNAINTEVVMVDTTTEKAPEKRVEKPVDLKKMVKLRSSEYKVGLFGGVKDLQLTVVNTSAQTLEKVVVELEYLKQNGQSVKKETFSIFSVPANGKKVFDVPASNRGVQVKHKLIKVQSKEKKPELLKA